MMNIKKILAMLVVFAFICTPVFAGDQPEYDVVGCDATNFFNDLARNIVCLNNAKNGLLINEHSDFTDDCDNPVIMSQNNLMVSVCDEVFGATGFWEYFETNANQNGGDPCFPDYDSHLATAFNEYFFEWQIVLQKKPQTDLDVSIRDCVLKFNSFTLFGTSPLEGAEQTGRISMFGMPGSWWNPTANPRMTVTALPGPNAPASFAPFIMDARTHPNLVVVPMYEALYTSKGIWEESIVLVMPETLVLSQNGDIQTRLRSGDRIMVRIDISEASTANINYGEDNVSINYVGIHGTEYIDTVNNNNMNEGPLFCGACL